MDKKKVYDLKELRNKVIEARNKMIQQELQDMAQEIADIASYIMPIMIQIGAGKVIINNNGDVEILPLEEKKRGRKKKSTERNENTDKE